MQLAATKARGRHIRARQFIPAGTTFLVEHPAARALIHPFNTTHCAHCLTAIRISDDHSNEDGETVTLMGRSARTNASTAIPCPDCRRTTLYCSETCKTADSEPHAVSCAALSQLSGIAGMWDVDAGLLRLILSVVARRVVESRHAGDPTARTSELTPLRCVDDLLSHKRHANERWLAAVTKAAEDIVEAVGSSAGAANVTVDDIVKIACQINSNSHVITDCSDDATSPSLVPCGVGLFPLTAMLNHSCRPNCVYHTGGRDGVMVVRTILDVEEGQECTLSYVDLMMGRRARRDKLLVSKFFWCGCERCASLTEHDGWLEGIICGDCGSTCVPPAPSDDSCAAMGDEDAVRECASCGASVHVAQVESEARTRVQGSDDFLKIGMSDSALRFLIDFRSRHGADAQPPRSRLHDHHNIMFSTLSPIVNVAVRLREFDVAATHIRHLVAQMRAVVPAHWPELGDYLYRAGDIAEIRGRAVRDVNVAAARELLNEARDMFEQSGRIRRVAFGEEHGRFRDALRQVERVREVLATLDDDNTPVSN